MRIISRRCAITCSRAAPAVASWRCDVAERDDEEARAALEAVELRHLRVRLVDRLRPGERSPAEVDELAAEPSLHRPIGGDRRIDATRDEAQRTAATPTGSPPRPGMRSEKAKSSFLSTSSCTSRSGRERSTPSPSSSCTARPTTVASSCDVSSPTSCHGGARGSRTSFPAARAASRSQPRTPPRASSRPRAPGAGD